MKVMWDVCSGLGGASEAFRLAGWRVIRIENNPILQGVEFTRDLDVLKWEEWVDDLIIEHGVPDFIWMSPPCREFSQAYGAPGAVANREGRDFEPDMRILFACQDLIDRVRPRHHVIENVAGAIPHLNPHLGPHLQKCGPFILWGRFPSLILPHDFKHSKAEGDVHSGNPMRSNLRAYVPMEISRGVLEAIEQQTTLLDWC